MYYLQRVRHLISYSGGPVHSPLNPSNLENNWKLNAVGNSMYLSDKPMNLSFATALWGELFAFAIMASGLWLVALESQLLIWAYASFMYHCTPSRTTTLHYFIPNFFFSFQLEPFDRLPSTVHKFQRPVSKFSLFASPACNASSCSKCCVCMWFHSGLHQSIVCHLFVLQFWFLASSTMVDIYTLYWFVKNMGSKNQGRDPSQLKDTEVSMCEMCEQLFGLRVGKNGFKYDHNHLWLENKRWRMSISLWPLRRPSWPMPKIFPIHGAKCATQNMKLQHELRTTKAASWERWWGLLEGDNFRVCVGAYSRTPNAPSSLKRQAQFGNILVSWRVAPLPWLFLVSFGERKTPQRQSSLVDPDLKWFSHPLGLSSRLMFAKSSLCQRVTYFFNVRERCPKSQRWSSKKPFSALPMHINLSV